ncbi:DUF4968 domain-containing protein, partial [candidate division KSB1 bacterium]|nr:DUF4968 domain-containing protein [candidate division KSB1 bacterium]
MKIPKILALLFLIACGSSDLAEKTADGVILPLARKDDKTPRRMKIEVVAENIFHITAAADSFSLRPSLIVENDDWPQVPFTLSEAGDVVTLSTASLTAKISAQTGEIGFYDATGSAL